MTLNIEDHAYSVISAGYTILPNQIDEADLRELRICVDNAFDAVRRAVAAGRQDPVFRYPSTQCLYVWGDACLRLLEHDAIHALTTALMREYRLWGYNVLDRAPNRDDSVLPMLDGFEGIQYHQDFTFPFHGSPRPFYLWHFVCLDDVDAENGATWVIPGSHRATELTIPKHGDHRQIGCGSAFQITAKAGDIIVLNPCCYHTAGFNSSKTRQRRFLAVQLCYVTLPPLHDHWAIAGPKIQATASATLRRLLGGEVAPAYPHAASAYVLPDGWETASTPYSEGVNIMNQVPAIELLRKLQQTH